MTNRTAANRYARALIEVAVKEAKDHGGGASVGDVLHQIEQQLAEFAELFRQFPALEKVLLNPVVPVPQKRAAVTALTERVKVLPIVAKLLIVLAERDRLVLVPDLLAQYRERLLEYQDVVRADVTTATSLGTDRAKAIEESLARLTGRTVRLSTAVDPGLIGGVVARIGSTIYDGSVTRQLQKMKARLVEGG